MDTTAKPHDSLREDASACEGAHNDAGRYTMDVWLDMYAAHAHDHAAQMLASEK